MQHIEIIEITTEERDEIIKEHIKKHFPQFVVADVGLSPKTGVWFQVTGHTKNERGE